MKTLEEVVEKRKAITIELRSQVAKQRKIEEEMGDKSFAELSEKEKKELVNIHRAISNLNIQIDTLTYVINYDSELPDATEIGRPAPMIRRRFSDEL